MAAVVRVQAAAALARSRDPTLRSATRTLMARAARAALRRGGIRNGEISITLLDDAGIAALNRDFLSHEGPTDVISFPLFESGEDPVGDIYIGFDQALVQAEANGVPPDEELVRLTVHGVLHVLGHDHPDGTDRMSSPMWLLQEEIVAEVLA